ncbi:phosphoribosylaminoimidazole-succinocarboxamide synthase [Platysternon megacephalum]|uniref:Phosphoribosylaminoimidazole-succinocarboxamide synthase n=1 Tax=Platysternon megacephalum TaxID=55544 RepID=A0A4D9DJD3_9SAUR|nr:phosphoribosylaminoimidazole-succinocarboxamide synthase [Platysternon megacephalum]
MNCLLRRLRSLEAADASWMGQEDEALGGFKCCNGLATVTKGVWMWDQPLWVPAQGRRVAVFLVDTEGSLDLQRRMETSIRLSVFSILLSSYWIFNISSTFTQTEADYLEIFINLANEVGETCNLLPIQRLDLLVRDWQLSGAYGMDGGQEFLGEKSRDLEATAEQPLVLGALRARGTRCYLLPHPGTGFTRRRVGMSGDMDEDFRQYLCDYVTSVVRSAGTHVRTDRAGQDVSRYLKTKRYDFSSPMKALEELKQELDKQMDQFLPAYKQRFKMKTVSLGLSIAGGVLVTVGVGVGVGIGVGVAAAVAVTVEEAVAIGVGVGGFGVFTGSVVSWFGARFGRKAARNTTGTNTAGQGDKREGGDVSSDQEPLLRRDR